MRYTLFALALPCLAFSALSASAGKPPDVQTIGGVTTPVGAAAVVAAPASPVPFQPAPAPAPAPIVHRPGAAALAVFGTLPRPEWTAAPHAEPKPAPVVSVEPATAAPLAPVPELAPEPANAKPSREPKTVREIVTRAPRDPALPAPSPRDKEAKR
ncbi:MAG: hypothetical protein U0704_05980 [Candidatus Eisenbacteria bacterium]